MFTFDYLGIVSLLRPNKCIAVSAVCEIFALLGAHLQSFFFLVVS